MGARTSRSSWIVLFTGLAVSVLGVVLFLAGSVGCAGTEMHVGNQCVTYGDGWEVARPPDRRSDVQRLAALTAIGLGGLLTAAGGWLLFFADRSARPATGVGDRIELARRQGWQFVDVDPELLTDWKDTPDFGAGQPAFAVLRGLYGDLDFVVFDFRKPDTGEFATAWIVYLPHPSRMFVEWATAQEPLYRRPLHMVGVRADAVVEIGREQHRSTEPDSVLRQVRALAEIIHRFEARASAGS
ncbi:hypothetical protein QLQ12_08615 [Actinoplanes sp. NEAU-A12]|uniref:Uncharacterized protein n=1 Tax=Actinoplanes sandaracinus TaxID=3045177 RepID=A0ABT6WG15_9ACTN|nr:hypothetical protein [Actinoplanes sandaracinus]MDI6098663.1 hypothetical protein [Actinoplanes sandaracinus]